MNAEQLKKILKPLLKECLNEILAEEGMKKLVSEAHVAPRYEQRVVPAQRTPEAPLKKQAEKKHLHEMKKKLLDEVAMGGFDPFHGTAPLPNSEVPNSVADIDDSDPGIDISSMIMENKDSWKKVLENLNHKKK